MYEIVHKEQAMENIISEFINIESSIDGLYREAAVKLCIM